MASRLAAAVATLLFCTALPASAQEGEVEQAGDSQQEIRVLFDGEVGELESGLRAHIVRVIRGEWTSSESPTPEVNSEGEPSSPPRTDEEREALLITSLSELLQTSGYPNAEVMVRLTRSSSELTVRVISRLGAPRRWGEVIFSPEAPPPDVRALLDLSPDRVLDQNAVGEVLTRAFESLRQGGYLEANVRGFAITDTQILVQANFGRQWRVQVYSPFPLTRADIEGVIGFAEPVTRTRLDQIRREVAQLYRLRGYDQVEVELQVVRDAADSNRVLLRVRPNPGERLEVVRVAFPGASYFATSELEAEVRALLEESLPTMGAVRPVDSDTLDRLGLSGRSSAEARRTPAYPIWAGGLVYDRNAYAAARVHLEELYQAQGFLAVSIGEPELIELADLDARRAYVSIPIEEGPRTMIHDVQLFGERGVMHDGALLAASGLVVGGPFSHLAESNAERALTDFFAAEGYLFSEVRTTLRFSADRRLVDVAFQIQSGPRVRVSAIRVEGISLSARSLVIDSLRFGVGSWASTRVFRESEEALYRLSVFATVNIVVENASVPSDLKVVVVRVTERVPQRVELFGGIGTGEGLRVGGEYGYRNLFGVGLSFSIRAQFAYQFFFQDAELEQAITSLRDVDRLERRVTISLGIPRLPFFENVRGNLDLVHVRDNERDFGYDKNGAVVSFVWQPERVIQLTWATELEYNNVGLFGDLEDLERYLATADVRTQRLLRVPQGESSLLSTRLLWSWDQRDQPFAATDGFWLVASAELGRTIDTSRPVDFSHYVKIQLQLTGYIPLAPGWVFAVHGRAGRINHLEGTSRTYPNRAFYLGGVDSIRGFLQDQLIPEDQAQTLEEEVRLAMQEGREPDLTASSIIRGGDFMFLARMELRFPLLGQLQGGLFMDAGNVWANAENLVLKDARRLIRWAPGLGLRLRTPIGLIAADYGFNVDPRADLGEPVGAFHFSIGVF